MIQSARDGLEGLLAPLEEKAHELSSELAELEREYKKKAGVLEKQLERVRAAISGLKGSSPDGGKEKKTGGSKKGRGLKTPEVVGIVAKAVEDGPTTLADLKTLLKEEAKSRGKSAHGIHKPLTVALRDDRFCVSGEKGEEVVQLSE